MRVGLVGLIVLVVLGVGASSAQAGSLWTDVRWVWGPGAAEPSPFWDVHYNGGPAANQISVADVDGALAVLVADGGDPVSPPPGPSSNGGGGFPAGATWACTAVGVQAGVCRSTPGLYCVQLVCPVPSVGGGWFDGVVWVAGGSGDDVVTLGPLSRRTIADLGPGDDRIDAANGTADGIGCGDGIDTVTADAADAVSADCESVVR